MVMTNRLDHRSTSSTQDTLDPFQERGCQTAARAKQCQRSKASSAEIPPSLPTPSLFSIEQQLCSELITRCAQRREISPSTALLYFTMDAPGNLAGKRQDGVSGAGRPQRSTSNFSSSSTSSDILVAPGPPATTSKQNSSSGTSNPLMKLKKDILAQVRDGKMLMVYSDSDEGRVQIQRLLAELRKTEITIRHITPDDFRNEKVKTEGEKVKTEEEDDNDGPNHRGTYSKSYILQHPEIKWVHRGQGRYLPANGSQSLPITAHQSPS